MPPTRQPVICGTHEAATLAQLEDVASRAVATALMADGHRGYVMPIGGVAAYRNQVSITGVGFDIACGNAAVKLDQRIDGWTRAQLTDLADTIAATISFGVGRSNTATKAPTDHPLFDHPWWDALPTDAIRRDLRNKARAQLGTVGGGNHYVDVFADETGALWIGVHFGSRGLGHTIASGCLALAHGQLWGTRAPETEALLDLTSDLGRTYWALMELAGLYAYAGREWVVQTVAHLCGGTITDTVHNHHNFAWREFHPTIDPDPLIVIRKGATPAFPGQRGFVGGSMGDAAVILRGAETRTPRAASMLYSTVHGAGRVMSRTEAAGKIKGWGPKARRITTGKVSWDMLHDWLAPMGVILRGGGLDEAPHAYRRLPDVLAAQGETVIIEHHLTPIIVVMAGANDHDPYKD